MTSDQTCDKWGESCGELTNCQLYNTDLMRQYISWFPAACLALSLMADVGIWWCVGDLQLYQDQQQEHYKMTWKDETCSFSQYICYNLLSTHTLGHIKQKHKSPQNLGTLLLLYFDIWSNKKSIKWGVLILNGLDH